MKNCLYPHREKKDNTTYTDILQVDCIVFDKTGTLTVGKPVVVNTKLFKNMVLREFFDYVAAAEVRFSTLFLLLSFWVKPDCVSKGHFSFKFHDSCWSHSGQQ
jgi:magnesium-transporting ATPase (P-type)